MSRWPRRGAWLVGLLGLASTAVVVVPEGHRGLRTGLGAPADLGPGLHLAARPLHAIEVAPARRALDFGLRRLDTDRPTPPPLAVRTREGQTLHLRVALIAEVQDARVDPAQVLAAALRTAATQWSADDLTALVARPGGVDALRAQTDNFARAGGVAVPGLFLLAVERADPERARFEADLVTRLSPRLQESQDTLDALRAQTEADEAAAGRADADAEAEHARQVAAEAEAHRAALATRVAEVERALATERARAEVTATALEAEAWRLRAEAQAEIDTQLGRALEGPGAEAYLDLLHRGLAEPAPAGDLPR